MNKQGRRHRDFSPLIQQVLAPYSIWKARPGEYRAACPVHKGDNRTSFRIFQSGDWKCFRCGAFGNMAGLLVHVQKLTYQQAQKVLGDSSLPVFLNLDEANLELPAWKERNAVVKPAVLREASIAAFTKNCPVYLLDRQFSRHSLRTYEIGYDLDEYKIVIPIRDVAKKLVGLTYRTDFDDDRTQPAKYWHDNFSKSQHLYGLHLVTASPTLTLVEGQLDAVRMHQLGIPAAAIMGSEISREQVALLLKHSKAEQLRLAFDNDEAGVKATHHAIRALVRTRFGASLSVLEYPGKDPGELTATSGMKLKSWASFTAKELLQ